ncbi:MAG: rhamnulokinase [Planctomycetaceae bacterium]|nr:rhamnulokinase [Planctomycetaceae bacterium]
MAEQVYLAVDLGASSGRVLAGLFDGGRLRLEEVHRFDNGAIDLGGSLYWDLPALWKNISDGLRIAGVTYGDRIRSVGVDTWGVDFALLGRDDTLLGNPYSYRDRRTEGMMDAAFARASRDEIFDHTGLQFMPFNTLYQVLAMRQSRSPLLDVAESFLMIPDLIHWLLTGVKANEVTNASTTQFYDPRKQTWAYDLFKKLDLPTNILGKLIQPGTKLGKLRASVAADTGLTNVEVVVPGTHDTASAVVAVPADYKPGEHPDWCYISSGTWSLMGVEVPQPVVSEKVRQLNFTNEGGVGGTTRLLKNITGLWLVQECRRVWNQAGKEYRWDAFNRLSAEATPLRSFIDPDDPAFATPGNMPEAIASYCERTGQPVPEDDGAVIRCALESIAMKYRYVLGALEELVERRIETIHIIGGGTQNRQLCQATADACGRRVVAGPIEATAIGNVVIQAIAAGAVGSLSEAREVIRDSFSVETFEPRDTAAWNEAYSRFEKLITR